MIARIHFVYERYLFAPLLLMSVMLGMAAAQLWRYRSWSPALRAAALAVVLAPTVGYAWSVNWSMIRDTRYEAERWFSANVEPGGAVGAFAKPQYLPRLEQKGFATFLVEMTPEAFAQPQPPWLVLSSFDYEEYNEAQRRCMDDLLAGRMGYELVLTIRGGYLGTGSSWLSLAGWGAPPPGKISPTIIVLRQKGSETDA